MVFDYNYINYAYYAEYTFDKNGKIEKTVQNILVLFQNDDRLKYLFIPGCPKPDIYDENYNIDDYSMKMFCIICLEELGFYSIRKIGIAIKTLEEIHDYDSKNLRNFY